MQRFSRTIVLVALLAAAIASQEAAQGNREAATDWLRTSDGWQQRRAMMLQQPSARSSLHPAVVATFQAGVSLFALLAFPAASASSSRPSSPTTVRPSRPKA